MPSADAIKGRFPRAMRLRRKLRGWWWNKTRLLRLLEGRVLYTAPVYPSIGNRILTDDELMRLTGAPKGAVIVPQLRPDKFQLFVTRPGLLEKGIFEIHRDAVTGLYFLYIDYVRYDPASPPGLGAIAFSRIAQQAKDLGFSHIELLAAGGTGVKHSANGAPDPNMWSEEFNGYYTWPRFGFDVQLQPRMQHIVDSDGRVAGCATVSDVIGRDAKWWRTNGDGWQMIFDLSDQSRSWATLNAYLVEKRLG